MRAKVWVIAAVVSASLIVTWLLIAGREPEWTTDSPAALAEFELGLQAQAKVYADEAQVHFAKAAELDPTFVMAKLFQVLSGEKGSEKQRKEVIAAIKSVDPSILKPRERFLLGYYMSRFDKNEAGAGKILASYLAEEPDDPFALDLYGKILVGRQDWDAAEKTFLRLAEVAPNRVEAYNQLGYLALARGQFEAGEKFFRTYMYLAADQANPHDSLGELLTLAGRYDEARAQFEQALLDKPDFCIAYDHLLQVAMLQGDLDGAEALLGRARAAGACPPMSLDSMRCSLESWRRFQAADWDGVWQSGLGECAKSGLDLSLLRAQAALRTGRLAEVAKMEAIWQESLKKSSPGQVYFEVSQASLEYIAGVKALLAGKASEAAPLFAAADRRLTYRGLADTGVFKLFNQLSWYEALVADGQKDAARRVLDALNAVNPAFVKRFITARPEGPPPPTPSAERRRGPGTDRSAGVAPAATLA